jgi:hypothetical protein
MLTHRELCFIAAKYLKRRGIVPFHKCQYVVCELERVGESPDAFGFCWGNTQLIEVKVSRADFLSDKKKYWRMHPEFGLGMYRSYLCPEGIIKTGDLPDGWGLLYVEETGHIRKVIDPQKQDCSYAEEQRLLYSILRREGIKPQIFSYKKYAADQTLTADKPMCEGEKIKQNLKHAHLGAP